MTTVAPQGNVATTDDLQLLYTIFPLLPRILSEPFARDSGFECDRHVRRAVLGIFALNPRAFADRGRIYHPTPSPEMVQHVLAAAKGLRYERRSVIGDTDWDVDYSIEEIRILELVSDALRRLLKMSRRQKATLPEMVEGVLYGHWTTPRPAKAFLQLSASLLLLVIPPERLVAQAKAP